MAPCMFNAMLRSNRGNGDGGGGWPIVSRMATRTGRSTTDAQQSILSDAGQVRMITATEVADAVLAVCTAAADAPTGQAIVIDGSLRA